MGRKLMRFLVTGAQGFIGSYVVDQLIELGHDPIIFDRHRRYSTDVEFWLGDLTDYASVTEAVGNSDRVIHCAGVLGTSETINNPTPAVETNIIGGLNIFQAMRQHNVPGTYVTVGNYWMNNSYSITKTTAERFAWMFNSEHGTRIAVVRALNAYGPRQKIGPVRKIMPNFIVPALKGEPITIYGDGRQIMDMIYVGDVAHILIEAAMRIELDHYRWSPQRDQDSPCKYEAGTGRITTVNDIASIVLAELGLEFIEGETVQHVPMRGGEPVGSVVVGNPDTLVPLYDGSVNLKSLEDGVRETIIYYQEVLNPLI
jgi:UDP-glucose 4-epimerase